jgi:hypothetical protein
MTHGALTEPSVSRVVRTHDRKGREGKGDRKWRGTGRAAATSFVVVESADQIQSDRHLGAATAPDAPIGFGDLR